MNAIVSRMAYAAGIAAYLSALTTCSENRDDPLMQNTKHHTSFAYTNELIHTHSPYLLQHAHNPVNWFPFSDIALAKARQEHKPIFLSIGYSACHWCHVMERESFENEEIAAILNRSFVCIKVDREERPDIDQLYMTAVQMMTGSGGWPLSVFLTPELKPFFGGTYFPPYARNGMPGFKDILDRIAALWSQQSSDLRSDADRLTTAIQSFAERAGAASQTVSSGAFSTAAAELSRSFDSTFGGFSPAPKFPPSGALRFLFRQFKNCGDSNLLAMATVTLDHMLYGGLYDQIGGGFHRYSVDAQWLVPHFEKMLYDNAQLALSYLEAWQLTHNPEYRRAVEETLDYILREMTDVSGAFYAAEDADSDGREGAFYVWSPTQIQAALDTHTAELVCSFYAISPAGNFEGMSIPHVPVPPSEFAAARSIDPAALHQQLAAARTTLRAVRSTRIHPRKDDKIIAAWNGLMISAFARAAQVFQEPRYLEAAARAADTIVTRMMPGGKLCRTMRNGVTGPAGFADDYACMLQACLDLYETDFNLRWLRQADDFARILDADFIVPDSNAYYYSSDSHGTLIARFIPSHDDSVPSANATAAAALLKLALLRDNQQYSERAELILSRFQTDVNRSPTAFFSMLRAMDFYLAPTTEFVLASQRDDTRISAFLAALHNRFLPRKVVVLAEPSNGTDTVSDIPLALNRPMVDNESAVYVCKNRQCEAPVTDPRDFISVLDSL